MLKIYFQTTCITFSLILIMYHENISAQPMTPSYSSLTNNTISMDQKEAEQISDFLSPVSLHTDTANRWFFLNRIKNHPSGYVEAAGFWSKTSQPMAAGFTWNSQLSQTIAGVPFTVTASLLINSFNPLNKIATGNISFDREQFLLNLREKLKEHLKKAYKPVFDTLNQITKTLKNYDSIRLLLNDNKYLQLLNDQQNRLKF